MRRFISLVLLAAQAMNLVHATPHAEPSPAVCIGFRWGVTIKQLISVPTPVYNQYVHTTSCAGPAWVQSSTEPDPPTSINPWGTTYVCQVPDDQYFCGETPVATCCGNITSV